MEGSTHFYIYNGKEYPNMEKCRNAIGFGISSRAFKHFIRQGLVQKVTIGSNAHKGNLNSTRGYENKKEV